MSYNHPPYQNLNQLPAQIYFRTALVPAKNSYPVHTHHWGEFVYSFSGVMAVKVGERHYLAPSHYGLWLPPHLEHQGLNRYEACHCSLYVSDLLSHALPTQVCALRVSPLVKALLEHLRQSRLTPPYNEADSRLLQVLLDQLNQAPCIESYLPSSDDPLLQPILALLDANPSDSRSLAEWAKAVHTTERTLIRRCQRDLGMTLNEWRQRLRIVKAMPLLEAGEKVEHIAFELGYGSASAFIAMFRRLLGTTPDKYRKNVAS